ncbi:hypothetical protein [Enterococcus timonensis]|uniref:hypothetical protein n=1 Tax=Enterococcus timonensis TaxID=1852364 RepID=UPI0008D8FCE2|nr:hypothetical protein [Enterococcus timonensis]
MGEYLEIATITMITGGVSVLLGSNLWLLVAHVHRQRDGKIQGLKLLEKKVRTIQAISLASLISFFILVLIVTILTKK